MRSRMLQTTSATNRPNCTISSGIDLTKRSVEGIDHLTYSAEPLGHAATLRRSALALLMCCYSALEQPTPYAYWTDRALAADRETTIFTSHLKYGEIKASARLCVVVVPPQHGATFLS